MHRTVHGREGSPRQKCIALAMGTSSQAFSDSFYDGRFDDAPDRRMERFVQMRRVAGLHWVRDSLRMENCWASCLGNCSEKLSREHLVSQSLFINDVVTIQGLPWCREPKQIGLASATAKILCHRHNNDLSPIDTAGADAFSALREMMKVLKARSVLKPHLWKIRRYTIDGKGLERWFLKTLINICCNGPAPIGRLSERQGRPSHQLVETVFGVVPFEGQAGLYALPFRAGEVVASQDDLACNPLLHDGKYIEGSFFRFRGLGFLLFLEPEGPKGNLTGVGLRPEDSGDFQPLFHQPDLRDLTGKYVSQVVTFKW